MGNYDIKLIETVIFLVLLFRALKTDLQSRRIENKIVVLLLVNKGLCAALCCLDMIPKEKVIASVIIHLFVGLLFILFYNLNIIEIGAGDIKLLCASEIYFSSEEIIWWLFIMCVVVVGYILISGISESCWTKSFPLAPVIFVSAVCMFLIKAAPHN